PSRTAPPPPRMGRCHGRSPRGAGVVVVLLVPVRFAIDVRSDRHRAYAARQCQASLGIPADRSECDNGNPSSVLQGPATAPREAALVLSGAQHWPHFPIALRAE